MATAYRTLYGTFWTGTTGRQLVARGIHCQMLAVYLITSPHANMIGLYYLPIVYAMHDLGMDEDDIRNALASLAELGFAEYDHETEWVWVRTATHYQVGKSAKHLAGARTLVDRCPSAPLRQHYLIQYAEAIGYPLSTLPEAINKGMDTLGITEIEIRERDRGSGIRERETGTVAPAAPLSTGSAWDDWREEWHANPKRRPLPLCPVNGDIPKFAEAVRRFPDDETRRRLMHAYFTTDNRQILKNPYSIGWFLHWADKLAEDVDAAQTADARAKAWAES